MAEAVLGAFLGVLLDRMASRETLNYLGSLKGVTQKLNKWSTTLSAIRAVLNDAEERQLTSESENDRKSVKHWLDDLTDLAYNVEDVLNKFSTEMLRRQVNEQHSATTSKILRPFSKIKFNRKMNSEINKISEQLQEISQRKDQLRLNDVRASPTKGGERPPSSSVLGGSPVVGREDDKVKIVEFLSSDHEHSTAKFQVAAIVGMPGVGKTTLAQFVFNHNSDAIKQFNLKVWVSVSDDFNLMRVTKAILELVTSQHCNLEEFSKIQDVLREELRAKKFLIVLDDVWNKVDYDLYDLWTKLQSPFSVGALGSKIIVTTREKIVAQLMGATKLHNLERVSDDHCWEIFEQHANMNNYNGRPHNLELLRKKIVSKCSGLPLAAKTLGGLLRCREVSKWEEILDNKLWDLSENSDIPKVLKLSYHYLPSNLKQCFAYCSILPNDYEFGEKQLILLWMAEGLIQQQPKDNKQMEDLGCDYFGELFSRSLFQKSSNNNSKYVMHDLVGDLARWAAGQFCFRLEDKQDDDSKFRKARHSSYICGRYDGVKKFEALFEVKRLRTFLPLSLSYASGNYLTRKVTFDLLPKLQYLRVLSLNGYQITELPNSIGKCKYLQYLDLSRTRIKSLPESVSTLYNLQTLILNGCSDLKALPTNMRNLINLRHLNNSNVPSLEGMPPQLGQLTNLQSLPNYVVGKASKSGLREIGPLLNLQGILCLSRLENVSNGDEAMKANLICKERLDVLLLKWSDSSGTKKVASIVLDNLKPHRNLKELTISGYCGLTFSTWIGNTLFSNMVLVKLKNCNSCRLLPPLGQLPSLKELHIEGMAAVESVGPEFYGEGSSPFAQLETLEFEDMQQWKKWFPCSQDEGIAVFPCLKMLSLRNCPKLEGGLPENPVSLIAKLKIVNCDELVVSLANYRQLRELDIDSCKGVVQTGAVGFELLESIRISELRLENDFLQGLTKVKDLKITSCEDFLQGLRSLWKNEDRLLQHLTSLHRLHIEGDSSLVEKLGREAEELVQFGMASNLEYLNLRYCESLLKLPEGLHQLLSLQELEICGSSSLVSFLDVGLPPSLRVIKIESCKSLMYFARHQIPPSLRRIEIRRCDNLKSLVEEESEVDGSWSSSSHCLEHLGITLCPSLTSLSFRGQLPRALKHLQISFCEQLELITENAKILNPYRRAYATSAVFKGYVLVTVEVLFPSRERGCQEEPPI